MGFWICLAAKRKRYPFPSFIPVHVFVDSPSTRFFMVTHFLLHRFHGLHQKLPASSILSSVFLSQIHSTFSLRTHCYTPDQHFTSSSSQSQSQFQSQSQSQPVVRTICSLVCQSVYQKTHIRFTPPKLLPQLDSDSLTHDRAITVVASLADEAGSMVALSFLY